MITVDEAADNLARYRFKLLEYELEFVYRAVIRHNAFKTLSSLKIKRKDSRPPDNEVPALTIIQYFWLMLPVS